jgi:nickel-dependent lactate racemase
MRISLPQLLWYENNNIEIDLPDTWDIEFCPMRGAKLKPLSIKQMQDAIQNPIGTPTLKEMARQNKTAVIIFDDITRPTRTFELAPLVIRELLSGGITEENISFVCALGAHGAHTLHEFRKKLGTYILEKFHIYNHNPYENCIEVGTLSSGHKLLINREVIEADLKIGIGCITAHPYTGFSGGGKILLPGVAHIDNIAHYHIDIPRLAPRSTGLGKFDNNIMRLHIDEAARMAGLDFKIDVIINERGETSALYAGDFQEEYRAAGELAKKVYATHPRPRDKDLIIVNAFTRPNEMAIALRVGVEALKHYRGTIVIIANAPEGQITHYLMRSFGRNYGGRQYPGGKIHSLLKVVIQAPHMDKTFADWFSNPEVITWTKNWTDTLKLLKEYFGPGKKVGVIPNATMQYYDS